MGFDLMFKVFSLYVKQFYSFSDNNASGSMFGSSYPKVPFSGDSHYSKPQDTEYDEKVCNISVSFFLGFWLFIL